MTKGGELKRDFIPVRHAGRVGLLDRVSGSLFFSSTGTDLIAGPVVTPAGQPGTLHLAVADGNKTIAESLALTGSLSLVKEGAGTLTVNRPGQTYAGGTRVAAGVLDTMNGGPGATYVYIASNGYLGMTAGAGIVIDPDAVFDFEGNCDYMSVLHFSTISAYSVAVISGTNGALSW